MQWFSVILINVLIKLYLATRFFKWKLSETIVNTVNRGIVVTKRSQVGGILSNEYYAQFKKKTFECEPSPFASHS